MAPGTHYTPALSLRSSLAERARDGVRAMAGYTPGEQPRSDGILKLNTNENPYPPSPGVFEALRELLTPERMRKYPDPTGREFRETAGRVLGVDPEGIVIGNGSDDILTILTRCFVPEGGLIASPTPSYTLYRTLAQIQHARFETVPFTEDWKLPQRWPLRDADLTFIPNPNSPSGTSVSLDEIARVANAVKGPLVLDEAYADFAETNGLELARSGLVIVTRSFSKTYSLAGMRFGFAVTDPVTARELGKVKDSYNCDVLSQAAATAAIADQDYLAKVRAKILATRTRLGTELSGLGFAVTPSEANFVWCRRPEGGHEHIYRELKDRGVLIRYMKYDGYGDGLRITVGTDEETDRLLTELREILGPDGR